MDRQTAVRIKKLGVLQNFCSQIMYFFPQLKGNSNKRDLEQYKLGIAPSNLLK